MFRTNAHEVPHTSIEGASTHASQPRERGGITVPAPVSVTSLPPATLEFRPHPLRSTSGGSPPNPFAKNPLAMTPSRHAAFSMHDPSTGTAKPVTSNTPIDAQGGLGTHASTSTTASTDTSAFDKKDVDALLDDMSSYVLLHEELRRPEDAYTDEEVALAKAALADAPPLDSQPATSADSTVKQPRKPISLDAVLTRQPAVKTRGHINLRKLKPDFEFSGEKLPVRPDARYPIGICRIAGNRQDVAVQVAKVLHDDEYHIHHRDNQVNFGSEQSPVLYVTDPVTNKPFRVFLAMSTQDDVAAPIGDFVKESDLLAYVRISRGDFQTLKSLYLIPLES